jgi:hypothetical protein
MGFIDSYSKHLQNQNFRNHSALLSVSIGDGENREKGWTGMVHLPWGDVREARIRAKFPRRGN